jgi:HlyD family secretion protein
MEPKVDRGSVIKKGDLLVELRVPEVDQELLVKDARVKQAEADLTQAKQAALAAKAGRESARAEIGAKLAGIHSNDAQVVRWQAEDDRARRLLLQKIFDQQTADEMVNQLRASEASLEEAKARWMSAKALYDQAAAQYNKAEADVTVAEANVLVSKASRQQWADWLSYKMITAPYDGVVTERNVHTDHFVQPANSGATSKTATPLFMVMRRDIMRLTVEVPELDAGMVAEGDTVRIHFQASNGKIPPIVDGVVERSSWDLDNKARTLTVEIWLRNPCQVRRLPAPWSDMAASVLPANPRDDIYRPGMYANVTILAKMHGVMTLPTKAIQSDILADGDRNFCYLVEDGKARKYFVRTAAHGEDEVQVQQKQRAGQTKWEDFTGKEVVVVEPPKDESGESKLVGPAALLDDQKVEATKDSASP